MRDNKFSNQKAPKKIIWKSKKDFSSDYNEEEQSKNIEEEKSRKNIKFAKENKEIYIFYNEEKIAQQKYNKIIKSNLNNNKVFKKYEITEISTTKISTKTKSVKFFNRINKKILKIKPEINIKSVIGKDEDEKIKEKNCYTSNKLYIILNSYFK